MSESSAPFDSTELRIDQEHQADFKPTFLHMHSISRDTVREQPDNMMKQQLKSSISSSSSVGDENRGLKEE